MGKINCCWRMQIAVSFWQARLEASPSPAHLRARMFNFGEGEVQRGFWWEKQFRGDLEMSNWAGHWAGHGARGTGHGGWLCGRVLFQYVQESMSKFCHFDWERQGDNNRQQWPGFLIKDK